ncbi:MAG: pyruvate kinase [Candidatus Magasanikbacteria bacterium]|nr:pyruvate kinase [Candidatus Magasanikbacteria bacterium]
MFKSTKIVATIGPACADTKTLTQMVKAGVNVARLNFSHGTYASHKKLINNIRQVEKTTKIPVAILQDLQGPKIRLGILPEKGLQIKAGEKIIFVFTQGSKFSRQCLKNSICQQKRCG